MKKLKFEQSISGYGDPTRTGEPNFSFAPEQVADIEDELANAWVTSGIASLVPTEAPKAEFAVASTPETAEAPRGRGRPRTATTDNEAV